MEDTMRTNWHYQLKVLFRIALWGLGLSFIYLAFASGGYMGEEPVEVMVSIIDADTSKPIANAVASWQPNGVGDFDCSRVVALLERETQPSSSETGVLTSTGGRMPTFATVTKDLGLPNEGIPENVIGMTTNHGSLEFRGYFRYRRHQKAGWILPFVRYLHADDRLVQVDAVGYKTKSVRFQPEDFRRVDGGYTLKTTILLKRETI